MLNNVALTASNAAEYGSVGQSAIYAILGYIVVFIGLVLLMAVIVIMGKVMLSRKAPEPAPAPKPAPAPAPAPVKAAAPEPEKTGPVAPGSAGEIMLGQIPERDAALLMAIVADKMGKPLNELRFKSIKEVK